MKLQKNATNTTKKIVGLLVEIVTPNVANHSVVALWNCYSQWKKVTS